VGHLVVLKLPETVEPPETLPVTQQPAQERQELSAPGLHAT